VPREINYMQLICSNPKQVFLFSVKTLLNAAQKVEVFYTLTQSRRMHLNIKRLLFLFPFTQCKKIQEHTRLLKTAITRRADAVDCRHKFHLGRTQITYREIITALQTILSLFMCAADNKLYEYPNSTQIGKVATKLVI
jgi:hypothetical protein